jgi:hypothetical protein
MKEIYKQENERMKGQKSTKYKFSRKTTIMNEWMNK